MHDPSSPTWPLLDDDARCPCLSGETYGSCCGPFHGGAEAPTAVRLMRSRYSAFETGNVPYLLRTWHPTTRPGSLELDPGIRWFRLDILGSTGGGLLDTVGTVEFSARYRADGSAAEQHENSRFVRHDGAWVYVDAI